MTLERTRTVLEHVQDVDAYGPTFCQFPEEGMDVRRTKVELPPSMWADLGKPDTITVTIEPGNRLNQDGGEP